MPRTKIVCTIGPASSSPDVVRGLIRAGMSVARINFSHGDHATHAQSIATLRRVAEQEGRLVAVMADLQGPKLRVGEIEGGAIDLREGDMVTLTSHPQPGATDEVPVPHPELLGDLRTGQTVLLDDGGLELVVVRAGEGSLECRVIVGGQLTSHKGINVPGAKLSFSALTPKDREQVAFALEHRVDFFALSFVRRAPDVRELRQFLKGADVSIIAKIEKPEALSVFDAILAEADGIMVARGDLGVETPAEEVPFHQKRIIRACNRAGKPVITATQMLQTMIEHPRPTRAEASDVANAILDGTDAVMLSGETAVGRYPIQATETMAAICANAEAHLPYGHLLKGESGDGERETITEAISLAAVEIASEVGAKAIITATMSGMTARMVARHRPCVPVVAVTPSRETLFRLALVWGVVPVQVAEFGTTDDMVDMMVQAARQRRMIAWGDPVVLTAGIPFGSGGETNMLKVHVVGETEGV
jgi:pyruvate kinase